MEKYEFSLTTYAQDNIGETLEILLSAAHDIASAQEQDFEKLKEKKWYNRLWEIITFNKDNQKLQGSKHILLFQFQFLGRTIHLQYLPQSK